MNDCMATVAWSSLQVTALASLALVVERLASRRGPRGGAWVAALSLGVIAAVTPLAFCPIPAGLLWRVKIGDPRSTGIAEHRPTQRSLDAPISAGSSSDSTRRTSGSSRLDDLWRAVFDDRLRAMWQIGDVSMPAQQSTWVRAWGVFVSVGATFALGCMIVGLWGVRDCRRRSIAVNDPSLLALLESLRKATGCRRRIEVRHWADRGGLAPAAAVGWRRPMVLLPASWRDWHPDDLKAVMAHEVAHIASGDYAAGVVARLGLALHFYHPLVHWIAARLLLQQELAADAQGARLAGGSRNYLRTLSRLALRLDESSWTSPAKMFLPARGQLIRRIHVLKAKMPEQNLSLPPFGRAIAIAVLGAAGLSVVCLRGPAPSNAGEKNAAPGKASVASPNPASKANSASTATTPFDFSYFPGHDMGFLAVRPAAMFRIPGMKRYAEMLNAEIARALKSKGDADVSFDVESIEQAVIGLNMTPRDKKKGEPGRLMTGTFVLRSVRDRDWLPLVKVLLKDFTPKFTGLAPVQFEGRVYYTSQLPRPATNAGFYCPDARTLVWASEEEIRAMIKQPSHHAPAFASGDDGKEASLGLYEIVINNEDGRWKFDSNSDNPEDIPIAPAIEKSKRVVLRLDWGETLGLKTVVTYDTDRAAADAAKALDDLLKNAPVALLELETSAKSANRKEAQDFYRVARLFVGACAVKQSGRSVELHGRKKLTAEEIAAFGIGLVGG
jgi:hypothetical protein